MLSKSLFIKYLPLLLILVIIAGVAGFLKKNSHSEISAESHLPEEEAIEIHYDEYGIELDKYLVESSLVRNRQTLGHILGQLDFTAQFIDRIVKEMNDHFDPRRVRAGNAYHIYRSNDTLRKVEYFIYDISALDFLLVDVSDSLQVTRGEKEITAVEKTASGVINSSLWVTLTENNLNPDLAIRLSEILAWEVDFYRIQRGDRFKVVYEEEYVGKTSVGIGRIDALFFEHHGREIYGFKFENDTVSGFFAPDGQNLRKVFLAAPIKFVRITSGYSASRLHPVLGTRRPHYGTDYAAPTGTPIYSVGDGVVTEARYTSGNGYYVRIRHNSVYDTQYLHMSRFASGIKPGKIVEQGEVIGYVGMTGLATGPHVCFRFWKNGRQVDHRREEFPSADPLHEDLHEEFFVIRDHWMKILESIKFEEEQMPV